MRLSCDRNDLIAAVTAAAQGIPARPQVPRHAGILVTALGEVAQFTATDGFTVFNCVTDAETGQDGQVVFPKVFADIVKTLPRGEVSISAEKDTGIVTCGKSRFTFPVLPGDDYPLPSLDLPPLGEVDGPEFRMALLRVLPATDLNSATPALTAVLLDLGIAGDARLVATDHYALAVSDFSLDITDCDHDQKKILIPGWVAQKAARMEGVSMSLAQDQNMIQVRSGGFSITCPQVAGKFPKWDIILSMGEQWTRLPEGIGDAVKRAALTLGEKEAVILDFSPANQVFPGNLTVNTYGFKGGFSESFEVDYEGEAVNVAVGHRLLKDALAWCDEISVEKGRPLLFRGEGVRYLTQVRRET